MNRTEKENRKGEIEQLIRAYQNVVAAEAWSFEEYASQWSDHDEDYVDYDAFCCEKCDLVSQAYADLPFPELPGYFRALVYDTKTFELEVVWDYAVISIGKFEGISNYLKEILDRLNGRY